MVDISAVRRIILIQVAIAITLSILIFMAQGYVAGISSFAGGVIGFTGSLVYAIRMLMHNSCDARKIMRAHYSAEAYKLAATILMFSLVFTQFKEVHALALIGTYAATLAVYWVALTFV